MYCSSAIIPLLEAKSYLSLRFVQERTSNKIDDFLSKKKSTVNSDLAYFNSIIQLEKELDNAFPEDELMRYYFTPLKAKEKRANEQITIGGMLLSIPADMKEPYNFECLIEYLKSVSKKEILNHFYQTSIASFVSEPAKSYTDLSEFMSEIDDVLVNPEDKWNLIDAAGNPLFHLEKLRELVCAVESKIEAHSHEFTPLMNSCKESFAKNELTEAFHSINFDISLDETTEVRVYPCLFMFNGLSLSIATDKSIRVFMGFFIDRIMKMRKLPAETDDQITLLKSLSDGTRFKALYSMRNRYSFGQELAEEFGSTRNAMYYHLEKLLGMGLIDCKVTDYRMLYTMNKKAVYDKLTALRDFLVGDWKPEDEEQKE